MSDVFQIGDLVTINSKAFVVESIEVGVRIFDCLQTNISFVDANDKTGRIYIAKTIYSPLKNEKLFKEEELYPFPEFWDLYDKKVGAEKCKKKWSKIKAPVRKEIMDHLVNYIASKPDKQYRKNPLSYLNGEHWKDEIIMIPPKTSDSNVPLAPVVISKIKLDD